jgi:hypothetical protein
VIRPAIRYTCGPMAAIKIIQRKSPGSSFILHPFAFVFALACQRFYRRPWAGFSVTEPA